MLKSQKVQSTLRGLAFITSQSCLLKPMAVAGKPSVTKFTQSNWTYKELRHDQMKWKNIFSHLISNLIEFKGEKRKVNAKLLHPRYEPMQSTKQKFKHTG